MSCNILLYGATGFSGRLIASHAKQLIAARGAKEAIWRLILAARDGAELRKVASQNAMEFRPFALDHHRRICNGLDGINVIINAAGPFAATAKPLVAAALETGCSYVDINGEVDVYRALDDLAFKAEHRGIAMVCGAGASAAGSDLLLDLALQELKRTPVEELGAVRIAMSQVPDFSRGSAATGLRLLREQVLVVRRGKNPDAKGDLKRQMVYWHEPIGRLERTFNLRTPKLGKRPCENISPQIASAANLVDTPTALHTIARHKLTAHAIESYVETGPIGRFAYQLGGMLSPLLALPMVSSLAQFPVSLLPDGPRLNEMNDKKTRHIIVLEIEDSRHTPLINWRLEAPNVYTFTARLALAVGRQLATKIGAKRGWVTPAEALGLTEFKEEGPLEDCGLIKVATAI